MTTFDSVWTRIQSSLKPGTSIKNWTLLKGFLGDTMKIVGVHSLYIAVDAPHASTTQVISKENFRRVWEIWPEYKGGIFPRNQMRAITWFSKYIISILHWAEQLQG
jgi:hypothetical protein